MLELFWNSGRIPSKKWWSDQEIIRIRAIKIKIKGSLTKKVANVRLIRVGFKKPAIDIWRYTLKTIVWRVTWIDIRAKDITIIKKVIREYINGNQITR